MLTKIDVTKIIINHFATLQNANSKKASFDDYLTFLLMPLLFTGVLFYFKVYVTETAINVIISTLSILVGLLFNVVVLIFDIIKRDSQNKIKNIVLKQILSNIAFTILLSIISILFTLLTLIENNISKIVFNSILFFLLFNFVITVLMILKRMFHLFHSEIDEINE